MNFLELYGKQMFLALFIIIIAGVLVSTYPVLQTNFASATLQPQDYLALLVEFLKDPWIFFLAIIA